MKYGFKDPSGEPSSNGPISLPKLANKVGSPDAGKVEQAIKAGENLGFVQRQAVSRRKPGPKRTEPQGKLTLTGPKRVLDRLQTRCDVMGGVAYWQAIEAMLDATADSENS